MREVKLSISIPYKQRLDNLKIVFEALANQTIPKSEFEVVVGVMEYCQDYVNLCKEFSQFINIISVISSDEFSIPRARNLAMHQAKGQVIIQMDADTLLPKDALQNLYNKHFLFNQNICIVGQVVGYGNNKDGDVETVDIKPYSWYQDEFIKLQNSKGVPRDPRFQVDHIIPWAFGWTGFIALPVDLVRQHSLYFDEDFHGWGVDDLEWSYRICTTGIPIVLCEDVYAIHLPHLRNQSANQKTERQNYLRFLQKWPKLDVELAHAFGDVEANSLFLDFMQALQKLTENGEYALATLRGLAKGKKMLIIGGLVDSNGYVANLDIMDIFDDWSRVERLPLVGMALPYLDKEFEECRILPSVTQLPEKYWNATKMEATRVSRNVLFT